MFRNSIMPLPLFDPLVNWKEQHLIWLNMPAQRAFLASQNLEYRSDIPYAQVMKITYENPSCTNMYAWKSLIRDMKVKINSTTALESLYVSVLKDCKQMNKMWFVTIGFNHQTWSIKSVLALIDVIRSYDWIQTAKIVFELHRENGEHPHIHILMETGVSKSKILEKLWAAKGIKKIVLKRSFIDIKEASMHHENYILGNKQESKIKYVEMDKQWRNSNKIEDIYTK